MPATRRGGTTGSTASRTSGNSTRQQQRLEFGRNGSNRVTKPSPLSRSESQQKIKETALERIEAAKSKDPPKHASKEESKNKSASGKVNPPNDPAKSEARISKEIEKKETSRVEPRQRQIESEQDPLEAAATRISETQIRKYWKAKEDARRAPRVHQQDLGVHEKILREFDLSSQFGPCIGIPRMKRWKRANNLGLNPPLEVLAVLIKESSSSVSGAQKMERAYIDTLMGGRLIAVE